MTLRSIQLFTVILAFIATNAYAGSISVIDNQNSGASGNVNIKANAIRKVSLTISDTGANDVVTPAGLDFGEVDADGTTGSVPGVALGDRAQYVAGFILNATRSGSGTVSLTVDRPAAGTLNAQDGVVVEDDTGNLKSLAAGTSTVSVIDNKAEGGFNKKIGITVHSDDQGNLNSVVRFTLSALP